MSETAVLEAKLLGRDATHRARNLDTHLTHGCIQLFCRFSRVRSECAVRINRRTRTFAPRSAGALRTLAEALL